MDPNRENIGIRNLYISNSRIIYLRYIISFNLSFDGVLKNSVFLGGGGVNRSPPPPIFICENNRKNNKIMHCVDLFFEW